MSAGCFELLLSLLGVRRVALPPSPSASTEKLVEEPAPDSAPAPLTKSSKILIVGGGGTIGSSTALWLARRGYTDVHILDMLPIPSAHSAGNDLNKIIGYSNDRRGFRDELERAYMHGWTTDPVFAPHFHNTGMLQAANKPEKIAALRALYENAVRAGWADAAQLEWLDSEADVLRRAPHLAGADIAGWKAVWSGRAGWAEAKDAIESVGRELARLGVRMTFGAAGTFKAPLLSEDGKTCVGVLAADGTRWPADRVVLATGAWSPTLVDLEGQCVSKCWIIGHLQLTPEEAAPLAGIPVVYHDELGFFFEPRENGVVKVCNEFAGYTRVRRAQPFGAPRPQKLSVPRSHAAHPTDTMPAEGAASVRRVVTTLLPQFGERAFAEEKMCWCTDTADAQLLLCEDPRWRGLVLATGDSGHTFHALPAVGREVADLLEGTLSEEKMQTWGWRPGHGDPEGSGRKGPPPKDLKDVPGWAHGDPVEDE